MTPIVLVPGLLCSAEVFAPQVAALWPYGPVTTASTLEGKTILEMAAAILAAAPPRFALVGISMGGYICLEIIRQAPGRVNWRCSTPRPARIRPSRSHSAGLWSPMPGPVISRRCWHRL